MGSGVRRSRSRVAVAAVGTLLLLPGCSAGPHPYVDVQTPQSPAERAEPRCPRDGVGLGVSGLQLGPGPAPGSLPPTFRAERARLCQTTGDDVLVAEGGQRHTVVEETAPVTAELLAALALPDQEFDRRDLTACPAMYTPPVYFLLFSKGEAYRPHLPADPCGNPREEIQTVLNGLPWTTRTTYTFVDASG